MAQAPDDTSRELKLFEFEQFEMGVEFRARVYACDFEVANNAAKAAFDRIHDLNDVFSDYFAESEVRRLCEESGPGRPVAVSEDVRIVLAESLELSRQTGGAFDVTVGPLTKLWRRARRREELPDATDLAEARALVGYQKIMMQRGDEGASTVELLQPGMRLDFGGIAKGYAVDEALKTLRQLGITRALVDGSGDIAIGAPPPGATGWTVEVEPLRGRTDAPPMKLLLANCAVATSGSAFQSVEIGGRRYSHIVDPRTGLGVEGASSVTVIAPSGMRADSLASAVSVMRDEAGIRFVESPKCRGVEVLVVRADRDSRGSDSNRDNVIESESSGFRRFVIEERSTPTTRNTRN